MYPKLYKFSVSILTILILWQLNCHNLWDLLGAGGWLGLHLILVESRKYEASFDYRKRNYLTN
jgi:hypothetical protein